MEDYAGGQRRVGLHLREGCSNVELNEEGCSNVELPGFTHVPHFQSVLCLIWQLLTFCFLLNFPDLSISSDYVLNFYN